MTDKPYIVVFRGDIVIGKALPEVKQNLKRIFKVDDARIDSLFTGKPVPLKTNLSLQDAEKYQTILQQAGIVVSLEQAQEKTQEKTRNDKTASLKSDKTKKINKPSPAQDEQPAAVVQKKENTLSDAGEWQLAPVGSLLQDKKKQQAKIITINVDHLALMPQEGNLLKDNERRPTPRPTINVEVLNWELTPYGEALLKEAEKKKVVPMNVDIASLSLAKNEGNLIKESEKKQFKPIDIDTSHLALVPEEQPPTDA